MITHPIVSYFLEKPKMLMLQSLRQQGFSFPITCFFFNSKPNKFSFTNEIQAQRLFVCNEKGRDVTHPTPNKDYTYIQMYLLSVSDSKSEEHILKEITKACKKHTPDAVSYSAITLYNEYENADDHSNEEVVSDPNSANVINTCYYLRGDKIARICYVPFIKRGIVQSEDNSIQEHEVAIASTPWNTPSKKFVAHFKYPY